MRHKQYIYPSTILIYSTTHCNYNCNCYEPCATIVLASTTRTHACTEPVVSLYDRLHLAGPRASFHFPTWRQSHLRECLKCFLENHTHTPQRSPPSPPCQRSIMAERMLNWPFANKNLLGVAEIEVLPAPKTRDSMSPSSGDVAQTPEPKSTSGLASVFKSLTGSKSSKSPNAQSPASIPQHLGTANTLKNAIYGGPPDFEQLSEQLKVGNVLQDRLAAAESLRHAVQDYPLSGVCYPGVKPVRARLTEF